MHDSSILKNTFRLKTVEIRISTLPKITEYEAIQWWYVSPQENLANLIAR